MKRKEFEPLKPSDRRVYAASELPDDVRAAIGKGRVAPGYEKIDADITEKDLEFS